MTGDDELHLTSYALGELGADEAASVERRLAVDAAARAAVEAARAVAAALGREAGKEPRLAPARRDAVRAAARAAMTRPQGPRVPSPASPRAFSPHVGGSMPKLQACPKCGAQFDVSSFASGQKFTCGACGTVVTAGAPAPVTGRAPGTSRAAPPSTPVVGKVPGTRGGTSVGAAVGHGPQYKPVERSQERGPGSERSAGAAAAASAKPRRERRARETDVDERRKSNMPLIAGAAGLLLAAGLGAFFVLGKKDKPPVTPSPVAGTGGGTGASGTAGMSGSTSGAAGSGTGPVSASGETLEAVEADYRRKPEHTSRDLATFLKRFKAIESPQAQDRAKEVAEQLIKYGDPTQQAAISEAHKTLGHVEFNHPIPEEITYYNEPFIRAVVDANAQRWFTDKEQLDIAERAWVKTQAHAKRLETDRVYRALTQQKANIARDDDFKNYNYATYFASPYLIFYSSKDETDEADMMKMSKAERSKALAKLDEDKKKWNKILAEKGKIYSQLYKHFMATYGEECELKDLMGEYGGRPDYPKSKRSFAEGVPLIIWIFSDREAFDYHHKKQLKEKDQSTGLENVAGYFSPKTGWVYLYDEASRQFEIDKNVHEGTHQLEHWFIRQKNEWATEFRVPQSFFGEGFAEYIGSVEMSPQRDLKFIGVNRSRLASWQGVMKDQDKQGKKHLVYPLQDFVRFEGYHEAMGYAESKMGIPGQFGLGIFYCQAWALVYFLNEYPIVDGKGQGKYRKQFNKYLNDILNYDDTKERYGYESFKKQFGLRSESDWKALEKEFRDFFIVYLKTVKPQDVAAPPPERDDWPGFVDPEAHDESNPEGGK